MQRAAEITTLSNNNPTKKAGHHSPLSLSFGAARNVRTDFRAQRLLGTTQVLPGASKDPVPQSLSLAQGVRLASSKHGGPCSPGPDGSRRAELSFWGLCDPMGNAGASHEHHLRDAARAEGPQHHGSSASPRDRPGSVRSHKRFGHWSVCSS